MDDIRIFICRTPKSRGREALAKRLFGISVRVRGYLLLATEEPTYPWEDRSIYLVHNDDLRDALAERYGPAVAKRFYQRQSLPVGHVTPVPVDCCEIIPHSSLAKENP